MCFYYSDLLFIEIKCLVKSKLNERSSTKFSSFSYFLCYAILWKSLEIRTQKIYYNLKVFFKSKKRSVFNYFFYNTTFFPTRYFFTFGSCNPQKFILQKLRLKKSIKTSEVTVSFKFWSQNHPKTVILGIEWNFGKMTPKIGLDVDFFKSRIFQVVSSL